MKCDNDVIARCWHTEASGVRVDVPLKGCLHAQYYGTGSNTDRVRVVLTSYNTDGKWFDDFKTFVIVSINENRAPVCYYAASSGSNRHFGTTCRSHLQG